MSVVLPLMVGLAVLVAVIVTCGGLGAVAGGSYNPEVLIVPNVELPPSTPPALQVTPVLVKFCVLPSVKVPVAVNCSGIPTTTELEAGVTAIDTRAGEITVSPDVPTIVPNVAEMVEEPAALLVAKPAPFTLATAGFEDSQVTREVRFC